MTPTLGIIIPVAEPHLPWAMDAVNSASDADEIVIFTEATGALRFERGHYHEIEKSIEFAAYVKPQKRAGEGKARNEAIDIATADWLYFLDADDLLLPGAVAHLRSCMAGDTDLAYAPDAEADDGSIWHYMTWGEADLALKDYKLPNLPVNILVERNRILDIGGYDETMNWGVERDMFIRLVGTGPVISYLLCPLVHLRSRFSTRNLDPEFRVNPGPFSERVRTGYYLREVEEHDGNLLR